MKTKKNILTSVLLVVGVLILLNILAEKFFLRLDFTEDERYTLSKPTKDILKSLEEPVTVTAFFSDNLPPQVTQAKTDFKDLLTEYGRYSKGMLVYEFINPNENEETEQAAAKEGIQPVLINVREKDQMKQQKAFLGAVIQMGSQKEVIPFMQTGSAMEYALSSSIKKLSVSEKPTVGFLQGHGEPSPNALMQVNEALTVLYNVEPVTLNDSTYALEKFRTVIIVAPKDSFPQSHLFQLDDFLSKGKNLLIACNRVNGDLSQAYGSTVNTGLESWLSSKGITIENSFVVDQQCAAVTVRQQQGFFTMQTNVSFPYLPVISNFADHPITKGLEGVIFQFASSITFSGDSATMFTPIVKTTEKSGTVPSPLYFDINKKWSANDFPIGHLTLGAAIQGKFGGTGKAKMVVFSDGDFPINGEGQEARQLQGDNVNLMVNAIDWLSDETGLIALRTKGVSLRPLDELSDGKKLFLKILNFMLPIVLILLYGFFRFFKNRNTRMKRMEENYV